MDQTYAEQTLRHAIRVLGDLRADDDDREDAARVIQAVLRRACPSEADLTDLLVALSRALHIHLAIRRILGELQRLHPPHVVEKVGRGVEQMMRQAFGAGDYGALHEVLLVALDAEAWASRIRDVWGRAALGWAIEQQPVEKYAAPLLISSWVHAFGVTPDWMIEIVEERPNLVTSGALPVATRWQLHHAAPSVSGWASLAELRGTKPVLEPSNFGSQLDIAVTTLDRAYGEATDEARKTTLRGWIHELTGTTT